MNLPIHNNILRVKVIPNASKTEIREITAYTIKIAVAAPPDKNKANKELLRFLKKETRKSAILVSGEKSREKVVRFL